MKPIADKETTRRASEKFTAWQKSLVPVKQNQTRTPATIKKQQNLTSAADSSAECLAKTLRTALCIENDELSPPPISKGTASEMLNRPWEWEKRVHTELASVERKHAHQPQWWYLCHIGWLENGVFDDPPAATFNGRVPAGLLSKPSDGFTQTESETLDSAVRNILRRLGGLLHVRHQPRVALDPPIPAAWWRRTIAEKISAVDELAQEGWDADRCHRVLRSSSLWGQIIDRIAKSYETLLDTRAIAAICYMTDNGTDPKQACRAVAVRCAAYHPEWTGWEILTRKP